MRAALMACVWVVASCAPAAQPPEKGAEKVGREIAVTFEAGVRAEAATGRVVVYLMAPGAKAPPGAGPADGPFWGDPQPMYGVDVAGLAPGSAAVVDDGATSFPGALSGLPKGRYVAQAVLDLSREDSSWRREPGNLYSDPVTIELGEGRVTIALTRVVGSRRERKVEGVEVVTVPSALLSAFRGREVEHRAAVVLPMEYDPNRKYAAVYHVPGFGGDETEAYSAAAARAGRRQTGPEQELSRNVFHVYLNPESPNGHTLFADSANNGPCGRALVTELIPALEARYPLVASPMARLVTGHSSGGWSSVWLAVTYPEVFGACWSSSPDPVDFRRFQLGNIYEQGNFYEAAGEDGVVRDVPSLRRGGVGIMTVRQENAMEEVMGPGNTSGAQWDSWQAVFGPRDGSGRPAALFDARTGVIDKGVAEAYRAYDIGARLRAETGTIGLILYQRVRLVVGDQDSFYLNEAVSLLKKDLEGVNFFQFPEGQHGYMTIVPGADHGTVFRSEAVRAFPGQMVEHLRRHKLMGE